MVVTNKISQAGISFRSIDHLDFVFLAKELLLNEATSEGVTLHLGSGR